MITNPAVTYGFESGNASGWGGSFDVAGSTSIQGGENNWLINPAGNYMGVLTPNGSEYLNNATEALLLNGQDTGYLNNTYSNRITDVDYGFIDVHLIRATLSRLNGTTRPQTMRLIMMHRLHRL